jgi:rhodanese-related sulfurtransferase
MRTVTSAIRQAILLCAVALVVGFGFNAFSRNGINPFKMPVRVPVAAADSLGAEVGGIKVISLEEAKQFVASAGCIIDARRKEDFDEGHIPGAILLDYYDMGNYLDRVLPLLSREQEIMVYCSEPSCSDSELLAKHLYSLGYTKLVVFKGGFTEWSGAGLSIEQGAR